MDDHVQEKSISSTKSPNGSSVVKFLKTRPLFAWICALASSDHAIGSYMCKVFSVERCIRREKPADQVCF